MPKWRTRRRSAPSEGPSEGPIEGPPAAEEAEAAPDATRQDVPDWARRGESDQPSSANTWQHRPTPEELKERFKKRRRGTGPDEPARDPQFDHESLFTGPGSAGDEEDEHYVGAPSPPPTAHLYYDPDDPWGILGVEPNAPWDEIAAAHRKVAKLHHPDLMEGKSLEERKVSEDRMTEANIAYSVLRRRYGR